MTPGETTKVLTTDATKIILLGWDFGEWKGKQITGAARFEIYTSQLLRLKNSPKDFGEIRICEITGGNWPSDSVTYNSFTGKEAERYVINPQTTIDTKVNPEPGGVTAVPISQPVMQRLIDGKTKGLAIIPLGLINASFYAEREGLQPVIRFNTQTGN